MFDDVSDEQEGYLDLAGQAARRLREPAAVRPGDTAPALAPPSGRSP